MSACVPRRAREGQRTRPTVTPPTLTQATKDAIGRALMQSVPRIVNQLRARGVPEADAEDYALECATLTYRSIVEGIIDLPDDPTYYRPRFGMYMKTMAWRMHSNRKRFKDVARRYDQEGGVEVIENFTYEVEPALELVSEIRAEPPKSQRFLLAMLGVNSALRFMSEAAEDAGMTAKSGKWMIKRIRDRAAARLAAV